MKVAFYKGTKDGVSGLFNTAVRWWTNGPYSHCEVVIQEYSDGKFLCASSANLDGGVRFKELTLNPAHWDILEVDDAYLPKVKLWFELHDSHQYDTLGLFGFVLRRGDGDKRKWFCSEAIAASMGFEEPWRFDPNTLYVVLKHASLHHAKSNF